MGTTAPSPKAVALSRPPPRFQSWRSIAFDREPRLLPSFLGAAALQLPASIPAPSERARRCRGSARCPAGAKLASRLAVAAVSPPGHPHAQGSRQKTGARGTGQSRGRWLGMADGGWDRLRRRSHGDPMGRRARQPRFPCTFPAAGTLVGVGAPSSWQKTLADPTGQVKRCWRSPPFRLAGDSLFLLCSLNKPSLHEKTAAGSPCDLSDTHLPLRPARLTPTPSLPSAQLK